MSDTNKVKKTALDEYRQHLVLAEQKAQDDYDRAILSLSGGALGVSFTFIDKILNDQPPACLKLLFWAWLCWGFSITAVILSYFFSRLALRKAIDQVDRNEIQQKPGGKMSWITECLNIIGGTLFVIGIILISFFTVTNLKAQYPTQKEQTMTRDKDEGREKIYKGYIPPKPSPKVEEGYVPPAPPPPPKNSSNNEKKK